MTATLIGKLLVFVVLMCSLLFAGIALGLYTNRINWTGSGQAAVPGEAAQGELGKRQAVIQELKGEFDLSGTRWETARAALARVEKERADMLEWYAGQIKALRTGKDHKNVITPVRTLVFKEGKLELDNMGYPTFAETQLRPLEELDSDMLATQGEIDKANNEIKELLEKQKELTEKIKVTRVLLNEEDQTQRKSAAELKSLEPLLYNEEIKSQALLKRQNSLLTGLKRFGSRGVAARP